MALALFLCKKNSAKAERKSLPKQHSIKWSLPEQQGAYKGGGLENTALCTNTACFTIGEPLSSQLERDDFSPARLPEANSLCIDLVNKGACMHVCVALSNMQCA